MNERIAGLHHVTAIAEGPRRNVDFYTSVLGLRLVKKTVNFDAPGTYHLYYGDETGSPGTVLTFFPFEQRQSGTVGRGQTSATAFLIPHGSVDYWLDRLGDHGVDHEPPRQRFDETVIAFTDHEGQPFELVTGTGGAEPWHDGPVPAEHALRGFFGVTLDSLDFESTRDVLEMMGYEEVAADGALTRFRAADDFAAIVDVLDRPDGERGRPGAGTVHHIAFRVEDRATQDRWRERIGETEMQVTEVRDRQYFQSIYFREPGGVLFELATESPGFDVDEPVDRLGRDLKLPPWLEEDRDQIEASLPTLQEARE